MAQKPINQAALSRRAATRDAVWPLIRAFDRPFAFKALLQKTDMHESSVRDYLKALIKAGFVAQNGYKYELVKDNGQHAPRINSQGEVVVESTKSEAIWRAARILGSFTTTDIMAALTGLEVPTSTAYVQDYLANLCKARYIVLASEGKPGKKARYRFVPARYTGPKPPKVQRNTAVFDANLNKVMWQSGFIEVDAEGSV
ncbi:MAG: hypothetical protein ACYC3A_05865 [Halothiobacillus sp.]